MKSLKDKEQKNKIISASTKEISEILGLSSRRIQQLAKENVLARVKHGKYDLPHSIQAYIEYLKEQNKTVEQMDFNQEKTLLTRANRMKAEMELKIMKGEVHRSEDIEKVMNDMLSSFRAQMLVIPGKVAPQILGKEDLEIIKDIIKKYIYESLQELSEYNPDIFYAKSKDKIISDEEDEEENSEELERIAAKKGSKKNGNKRNKSKK